jgi:Cu2+-containing amine oxidase
MAKAVEGKAQWKADEFTVLRVESTKLKNSHQRKIAYDLIPTRYGTVRGLKGIGDVQKENMDFVNFDFWVTRTAERIPYHKVPAVASNGRPLAGAPATVWYSAPALHVPRGEDFGKNGGNASAGVALTTWIEFTLRPRDLFDSTPLYP